LGDLTVENREDRVSIYGSIDIMRDQAGLAHAEQLQALLNAIVAALQAAPLPAAISIKTAEDVTKSRHYKQKRMHVRCLLSEF